MPVMILIVVDLPRRFPDKTDQFASFESKRTGLDCWTNACRVWKTIDGMGEARLLLRRP
jgi:hypothetical protein